ncbi:MAG: hypothetical protein J6J05_05690 [Peptococcaceae bacterium]|nr:hypothetical protein [Peptococcaceae bacterium]MBP3625306.1 hypothetical protein [Peptococcaceae bacterium]
MSEANKINKVHYLVVAAFCLLFRFVPGFAGITDYGMGILGCFIGAIYGWMTIGMFWPSIMALAGMCWSIGYTNVLVASFGNMAVVGLMVCMPVIAICSETGAFNWLIDKLLTSKAMQGKGWLTVWVIFFSAFMLGFTNPIIMCMVFCSFITTICKQVGIQKNEKAPVFLYLGVAFASMLGQILFPFMGTGLTLIMAYNAMFPDFPLDFMKYLMFILPMSIIMITVFVLLCKFVFRVDVSKIAHFTPEGEAKKLTREQGLSFAVFGTFIITMVIASLPQLGTIAAFLGQFSLIGISFFLICVIALLKDSEGNPIMDPEASMRTIPWGQVLMVGFIMVIATYMNTPETGIAAAMSKLLTPFTTLPPLVFVVVALAVSVVLTNIANNMIVVVLVMPFMFNFAQAIGMAPTGMIALLFMSSQLALATPAASPVAAVAMGNEMADASKMTMAAIKILPICFVFCLLFGWPLANIIF